VHQRDQAIRRGLLELLELTPRCIALGASGLDVPACLLVLSGCGFVSSRDFMLQSSFELLDVQLEHSDPIGRDHTLGQDVLRLFLVGSAQETQLVLHGSTTLLLAQTRLEETPKRLLQVIRSADRLVVRLATGGTNSRPVNEGTAGGIPPGGPACAPDRWALSLA
jgi:hypothetical protein